MYAIPSAERLFWHTPTFCSFESCSIKTRTQARTNISGRVLTRFTKRDLRKVFCLSAVTASNPSFQVHTEALKDFSGFNAERLILHASVYKTVDGKWSLMPVPDDKTWPPVSSSSCTSSVFHWRNLSERIHRKTRVLRHGIFETENHAHIPEASSEIEMW